MTSSKPRTRLIVISAPSGAGKTTLCSRLLAEFPQLVLSISTTTRAPRGAEQNGREYYFVDEAQFRRQAEQGGFAEWAVVHGNYYGTSRESVNRVFAQGRSLLLDIDVQGAKSLAAAYPKECFRIFVSPPSFEVLESRLIARATEDARSIQKRLANAKEEMKRAEEFDKIVVNDELEKAYAELREVVRKALSA